MCSSFCLPTGPVHRGLLRNLHLSYFTADAVLEPESTERESFDVDDYKSRLSAYMSDAWYLAKANVKSAQRRQKIAYDRTARPESFQPGVFFQMPGSKQMKAYKFAWTFYGVQDAIDTGDTD